MEFNAKSKEIRCNGEIKTPTRYEGSAGFDAGSIGGRGPIPGLYYPGIGFEWMLGVSLGAHAYINTEYPDCYGENEKCGGIRIVASPEIGVIGFIVNPDVLSVSGGFTFDAVATAKFCLGSGLQNLPISIQKEKMRGPEWGQSPNFNMLQVGHAPH